MLTVRTLLENIQAICQLLLVVTQTYEILQM